MSNQWRISEWVDFLTKYAEEVTFEGCGYKLVSPEDADEIADELQALQAEVERLRAQLEQVEKLGWFCPDPEDYPNAKCERAEKAEAEVERLRHDIERHMAALTEFDNEVEQLRAERAALRADAERYRWLRGEVHGPHVPLAQVLWKFNNIRDNFRWTNLSDGQTLDEHIDAARSESQ